ncbi:hypothetical protein A2625_06720 [candidate division WOR-1 bacterium RIFCSPHIGHO2_01_FULL_53_15]|uniref:Uncharacterized protein n=1 Tax=candidate division WOR-1 bacterium RIFCSPHIGHO2_01_FULL_53_15 TaxID=1802564 RepID=A0A1F4Q537_UNCSA|nr:MAG: hypothetical protein A2625_06720 [candidate division WOR-1 bacterium RIFCSPHIGHO2_01_FULL_53_15]OGC10297.1 MAG: hypothetical protein A3D23_06725 [candidate division WOR-1 bacterium RIFCSPHIGHO2_02_FULL_53_26]
MVVPDVMAPGAIDSGAVAGDAPWAILTVARAKTLPLSEFVLPMIDEGGATFSIGGRTSEVILFGEPGETV